MITNNKEKYYLLKSDCFSYLVPGFDRFSLIIEDYRNKINKHNNFDIESWINDIY